MSTNYTPAYYNERINFSIRAEQTSSGITIYGNVTPKSGYSFDDISDISFAYIHFCIGRYENESAAYTESVSYTKEDGSTATTNISAQGGHTIYHVIKSYPSKVYGTTESGDSIGYIFKSSGNEVKLLEITEDVDDNLFYYYAYNLEKILNCSAHSKLDTWCYVQTWDDSGSWTADESEVKIISVNKNAVMTNHYCYYKFNSCTVKNTESNDSNLVYEFYVDRTVDYSNSSNLKELCSCYIYKLFDGDSEPTLVNVRPYMYDETSNTFTFNVPRDIKYNDELVRGEVSIVFSYSARASSHSVTFDTNCGCTEFCFTNFSVTRTNVLNPDIITPEINIISRDDGIVIQPMRNTRPLKTVEYESICDASDNLKSFLDNRSIYYNNSDTENIEFYYKNDSDEFIPIDTEIDYNANNYQLIAISNPLSDTRINLGIMINLKTGKISEASFDGTLDSTQDILLGDYNGDGIVNNKDYGLLMQFLNGWDVDINKHDINNDGVLDYKDCSLLMQFLNGWDVELGSNYNNNEYDVNINNIYISYSYCPDGILYVNTTPNEESATWKPAIGLISKNSDGSRDVFLPNLNKWLIKNNEFTAGIFNGGNLYIDNKIVHSLDLSDSNIFYSDSDSQTTISSDYAFNGCKSLTFVNTTNNSLNTIGKYAFQKCLALKDVVIGNNITQVGTNAFLNCVNIENVYISDISAWCNIYFSNLYSNPLWFADNLFINEELITDLIIPDEVTTIYPFAFCNYNNLKSVTITDGVTSIGSDAFGENCGLTEIIVDSNNSAFSSDDDGVLFDKQKTILYRYPQCKSAESYEIPTEILTISAYAFSYCKYLKHVNIISSVISINEGVFYSCRQLETVTITDATTQILSLAFANCILLKEVTIPNSVTYINDDAFSDTSDDLTFKCSEGSYADTYAKSHGIKVEYV